MSERFTEAPVSAPNSTPQQIEVPTDIQDQIDKAQAEKMSGLEQRQETKGSFSVGQEVTVLRNGKDGGPNYTEGGWTVTGFLNDEHDSIMVSKEIDGEVYDKSVAREGLEALNPVVNAEKEPLGTTEKAIADIAIEDVGIKNPTRKINENAQVFEPGEIRKLMEADRKARAFEPGEIDIFNGLSQEAQSEIKTLRSIEARHGQSHRDEDFAQAAQDKRDAFSYKQSLSDEAKQFLHESKQL